ncbi:MAG: hypothetical protein K2X64_02330 [Rhodocyclaceae bacterium]|nr:hypothetical protein [Rhodocyclaceae bacterium]
MNKFNMTVLALSLAWAPLAMADSVSKKDYAEAKAKIATELRTDREKCGPFSGNAKDICILEAKGREDIAMTELEARREPTSKHHYKARVAKIDAEYAVAKERCDDLASNRKDVCVKEAEAAEVSAKADAEAQMKIWNANTKAKGKSAAAHDKAAKTSAEARSDAASEKLDANYDVAKEKCDVYAGASKEHCLIQAKAHFGK